MSYLPPQNRAMLVHASQEAVQPLHVPLVGGGYRRTTDSWRALHGMEAGLRLQVSHGAMLTHQASFILQGHTGHTVGGNLPQCVSMLCNGTRAAAHRIKSKFTKGRLQPH
eukprot:CAMPEP_0181462720 /NCGR_PEP_ID=MMETSP1110-20121109/34542_1 /TAXON_ID=174948 /ORGANISM="Symbiodinium sp., Strain CCMP421" /LENGTH=109 /DNA_ID=CAMNT_0023587391 /DNA_START=102 /DNA_END=428 /DNA_ORIENTATION=+